MEKILVTGATGHYGKAVIDSLIQKGVDASNISALVRNEPKSTGLKALGVNIQLGNYDDYESMLTAFDGIEKVLFVSSSDLEDRSEQQSKVVQAAKSAGVSHIIYTSIARKTDRKDSFIDFILNSHMDTEQAILDSGMKYTFLRNGLYLDSLPWFLGETVLDKGIYFPAGDGRVAFALRKEMAEAAASILIENNHEDKSYDITGNPISFQEIAEMLSRQTGSKISYVSPDLKTYKTTLMTNGVPDLVVEMLAGFAEAARQGELAGKDQLVLENLLGRTPTGVASFLLDAYVQNKS